MPAPRLMAVLAHPDDESLGVGGTLAKYASTVWRAISCHESQVVAYERLHSSITTRSCGAGGPSIACSAR